MLLFFKDEIARAKHNDMPRYSVPRGVRGLTYNTDIYSFLLAKRYSIAHAESVWQTFDCNSVKSTMRKHTSALQLVTCAR